MRYQLSWATAIILAIAVNALAQDPSAAPGMPKLPSFAVPPTDPPPPNPAPPASTPLSTLLSPDTKVTPPCGDILPPSVDDHCDHCPGGFFADVDYLFMRARRRAEDFAITSNNTGFNPQGSVESVGWDSDSGARIGAGYRWPGSGWETGLYYTYFHASGEDQLTAPPNGVLFTTLPRPGANDRADAAYATTALNYQLLDLEVARSFNLCDCFALRVFGGGRFAWIDQGLYAVYSGANTHDLVSSPIEFQGAGIRVGGEGQWKTRWGFSFYARAAGSLVAGDFHTRLFETTGAGTLTNINEDYEKVVPVAEMGLGVAWQYRNFHAKVGYEITDWFNMVDSPDISDDVNAGKLTHRTSDLSLEGLVVELGLDF